MFPQKLQFKLLTPDAKAPEQAHNTDAGYDLFATAFELPDKRTYHTSPVKIRTGVAVNIPKNWGGRIEARSSLALKGWSVEGGVIDAGFHNELIIIMNHNNKSTLLKAEELLGVGSKVAQLVIGPVANWETELVTEFTEETERGLNGFGSTGV